jgi:hypothetical protein
VHALSQAFSEKTIHTFASLKQTCLKCGFADASRGQKFCSRKFLSKDQHPKIKYHQSILLVFSTIVDLQIYSRKCEGEAVAMLVLAVVVMG